MKRVVAGLGTVALMGFLLWSGVRRPIAPGNVAVSTPETPQLARGAEARIKALLDSAASGDVPAYLASFGDPLRSRLEREAAERGRDAFTADLRRSAGARKSHAVFAPEPESETAARVVVETVYPDRNERQTYRLELGPDGWLVTGVETVRGHQPQARFGTPANYQEPEGVPVQGALTVETGTDTQQD